MMLTVSILDAISIFQFEIRKRQQVCIVLRKFMNVMEKKNARYGMGLICIGGGEATAMVIEKL